MRDDYLHPEKCIVCGTEEQRWVDVFICDHCHHSGRAAVEFDTMKQLYEQYKRDLEAYQNEAPSVVDDASVEASP